MRWRLLWGTLLCNNCNNALGSCYRQHSYKDRKHLYMEITDSVQWIKLYPLLLILYFLQLYGSKLSGRWCSGHIQFQCSTSDMKNEDRSHLTESFNIFHHIIRYFGPIWNPIIFSEPNSELVPSNPSWAETPATENIILWWQSWPTCVMCIPNVGIRAANLPSVFTITKQAPTRV